jgi:hypothetical protein
MVCADQPPDRIDPQPASRLSLRRGGDTTSPRNVPQTGPDHLAANRWA